MRPDLSSPETAHESIRRAHYAIRPTVHRTPLLGSRSLSEMAGKELLFKAENLQLGGAFKVRGALNKTLSLNDEERSRGLIAHSSGNHAQGVALAARAVGTTACVVMPEDATPAKLNATIGYGAEVIQAGRTEEDRRLVAMKIAEERGLTMIPPFDDPFTICGQGTVGIEIVEETQETSAVLVPIGGGGLIAGVALALRALSPTTRIIGVEPERAARAFASLAAGRRLEIESTDTIADGLRPHSVGELNWEVIRKHVDEVITVSEEEILRAVRLMAERTKLVVEPSGAVTVAAALKMTAVGDHPHVAILSGGNVSGDALARAMATPLND